MNRSVTLIFISMTLSLTGCNHPDNDQPVEPAIPPEIVSTPPQQTNEVKQPIPALNLAIPSDLFENKNDTVFEEPALLPDLLNYERPKKSYQLSGQIFLDDEEEDTIKAFEGAEIKIKIDTGLPIDESPSNQANTTN